LKPLQRFEYAVRLSLQWQDFDIWWDEEFPARTMQARGVILKKVYMGLQGKSHHLWW
jgi:hypothetical protein